MPVEEVLVVYERVGVGHREDLLVGCGLGELPQAALGHLAKLQMLHIYRIIMDSLLSGLPYAELLFSIWSVCQGRSFWLRVRHRKCIEKVVAKDLIGDLIITAAIVN